VVDAVKLLQKTANHILLFLWNQVHCLGNEILAVYEQIIGEEDHHNQMGEENGQIGAQGGELTLQNGKYPGDNSYGNVAYLLYIAESDLYYGVVKPGGDDALGPGIDLIDGGSDLDIRYRS